MYTTTATANPITEPQKAINRIADEADFGILVFRARSVTSHQPTANVELAVELEDGRPTYTVTHNATTVLSGTPDSGTAVAAFALAAHENANRARLVVRTLLMLAGEATPADTIPAVAAAVAQAHPGDVGTFVRNAFRLVL